MKLDTPPGCKRWACPGLAAFAYFVAFPDDLAALLAPLEKVLNLTRSVAVGAYVLLGLLIVGGCAVKIATSCRVKAEKAPMQGE